jgi:hypothetical protein
MKSQFFAAVVVIAALRSGATKRKNKLTASTRRD